MSTVDLVDVGGGNIGSVKRCLERLDISYSEADVSHPPDGNKPVLLPGVGAFGPVMDHLRETGFDKRLKDLVKSGTPYLGICVGMQILFDSSEEAKGTPGLGLIPGTVRKFQEGKVPQIGWNLIERRATHGGAPTSIQPSLTSTSTSSAKSSTTCANSASASAPDSSATPDDSSLLFPEAGYVYFVNSYYPDPVSREDVLYWADYYVHFCAAVSAANITAFQFHPEKSGEFGKILLTRWVQNVG